MGLSLWVSQDWERNEYSFTYSTNTYKVPAHVPSSILGSGSTEKNNIDSVSAFIKFHSNGEIN